MRLLQCLVGPRGALGGVWGGVGCGGRGGLEWPIQGEVWLHLCERQHNDLQRRRLRAKSHLKGQEK